MTPNPPAAGSHPIRVRPHQLAAQAQLHRLAWRRAWLLITSSSGDAAKRRNQRRNGCKVAALLGATTLLALALIGLLIQIGPTLAATILQAPPGTGRGWAVLAATLVVYLALVAVSVILLVGGAPAGLATLVGHVWASPQLDAVLTVARFGNPRRISNHFACGAGQQLRVAVVRMYLEQDIALLFKPENTAVLNQYLADVDAAVTADPDGRTPVIERLPPRWHHRLARYVIRCSSPAQPSAHDNV